VSPPKSTDTQGAPVSAGAHRKPRPDLYTALLVIALIAILIGILFLYLEMSFYQFKLPTNMPVVMVNPFSVFSSQFSVLSCEFILPSSSFSLIPGL
jgi:hypothetical protein